MKKEFKTLGFAKTEAIAKKIATEAKKTIFEGSKMTIKIEALISGGFVVFCKVDHTEKVQKELNQMFKN